MAMIGKSVPNIHNIWLQPIHMVYASDKELYPMTAIYDKMTTRVLDRWWIIFEKHGVRFCSIAYRFRLKMLAQFIYKKYYFDNKLNWITRKVLFLNIKFQQVLTKKFNAVCLIRPTLCDYLLYTRFRTFFLNIHV